LVFCDASGRGEAVPADALALALADTVDLRLAVLNACHTARASERDAFHGVAQVLLEHIPAVVAMQFAISDAAAITFAGRFYAALSHGWSVDRAVGDARRALSHAGVEWATPVVHLRGDGIVFDVQVAPPPAGGVPARRWRRAIPIALLLVLALGGAGGYALVARGDGDDQEEGDTGEEATAQGLTGCPLDRAAWTQHRLAADPRGDIIVAGGTLAVEASFLASRRVEERWDVLVGVALSNGTPEEISLGEHYVQQLVVAARTYGPWCFDPYTTLAAGRTADLVVGFEVTCEPVGRIELVAGERLDVPIVLTPESEPGPC
jgi:hypothetical protein